MYSLTLARRRTRRAYYAARLGTPADTQGVGRVARAERRYNSLHEPILRADRPISNTEIAGARP